MLVRISLVAYKKNAVSHSDKVKGLLLFMWRQIQNGIKQQVSGMVQSLRSSNKGHLLRGSQVFNER